MFKYLFSDHYGCAGCYTAAHLSSSLLLHGPPDTKLLPVVRSVHLANDAAYFVLDFYTKNLSIWQLSVNMILSFWSFVLPPIQVKWQLSWWV